MVASTVLAYIEPDPGVQWTQARIDDLVTALTTLHLDPDAGHGGFKRSAQWVLCEMKQTLISGGIGCRRCGGHLSREQKQLAIRLHSRGWRLIDIAREVGCTAPMVGKMASGGSSPRCEAVRWEPREGRLTVLDREQILVERLARGDTLTVIARGLKGGVDRQ